MKIACISGSQVPSRTANSLQVMKACQALCQLGHEVHLFLPRLTHRDQDIKLPSFYGLTTEFQIHWLPSIRALHRYDLALQAVWSARRIKADLTYVWLLQAGVLSQFTGMPVIIELHGPPEGRFGPSLFRLFCRHSGKKRLLVITRALASQLHRGFGISLDDQGLLQVCPNGVDLERYVNLPNPSSARQELGLPENLTAAYTGHLYAGRGLTLLAALARRFPQVSFVWVGGHPAGITAWREHLASENINNVTLAGFVENSQLPLYQAASDILLMPYEKAISGSSGGDSSSYASPMKMFEYMASRRPIISSDLPVLREVLNPSNAVLCPPEDINAWVDAFGNLVTDHEKRLQLALRAWQDVQQYTWLERARKALAGFVG